VLRAVARANPEREAGIDWTALALSIGSDVSVCFESRLSWMTGVGETVAPVETTAIGELHVVVANPRVAVPDDKTAQVYRALRAPPLARTVDRQMPLTAASANDLFALVASGNNALERAAIEIVPEIATVLSELAALTGAKVARMSGGGPTCFAIFDAPETATAAAATLRAKRPSWWVAASALA
jgi:4-diphosphocytidyl-2-C-methyl-D-erythritol kinase